MIFRYKKHILKIISASLYKVHAEVKSRKKIKNNYKDKKNNELDDIIKSKIYIEKEVFDMIYLVSIMKLDIRIMKVLKKIDEEKIDFLLKNIEVINRKIEDIRKQIHDIINESTS